MIPKLWYKLYRIKESPHVNTRSPIPPGYPHDSYTDPDANERVAMLRGDAQKIGPSITLKVMAGDKFNLRVSSWYKLAGATPQTPINPLPDLLTALADGIAGAGNKFTAVEISNSGALTPGATNFLNSRTYSNDKPKAYINWVLFDEQFNLVPESSGFEQVGDENLNAVEAHVKNNLMVSKNGYLYIYVSNETPNIDVFFDNLQLTHIRGPLLEETHYYPFGLTMQGISSKALAFGGPENKRKFNKGSELQNKEFSDGSGLELYATNFRSLDPQLGRWWQIDPKPDYAQSLYSAMGNNPILYNDPLGDTARIHFRVGFLGLGGKRQVDYNGGKLTNTDGSAYTGKVKGFLKKAVGGLDRLSSGGNVGKGLVNDIVSSKETVNIIRGDNSFTANDKKTGMTNVVRWDPSNASGGPDANLNTNRPAFIGFGHELAHAQDQITDGNIDYNTWYTTSGGIKIPNAEKYSTHIENLLRAENGINLRAFYSIGQNASGARIGEGPVLIPGTRTNANYPTISGVYWDDEPDGPSTIPFVYY